MAISLKTGLQVANEAALQLANLQSGRVAPITTGTAHLDEALLGGFLPGSVLSIFGYSFHGKSYELEGIQRHVAKTYEDVIMLNCQWELEGFKVISRDLSYQMDKSVKDIIFDKPTEQELPLFKKVLDSYRRPNMYFQPEPVSSDQFEEDVEHLIAQYPNHRILVSIDNLENILVDKGTQKECMDRMLYRVNVLKKRHPFISFIILNQLNNDYVKRCSDLKSHMPIASDGYQTTQLVKLSDVVLFKLMPTRFGIQDKFMVFGKGMHPHLDAFKVPATGSSKVQSFDPYGNIFYVYLKARETTNDFETIYAKSMYTREEKGVVALSAATEAPVFPSDNKNVTPIAPMVEKFTSPAINKNKGVDFEDDAPF